MKCLIIYAQNARHIPQRLVLDGTLRILKAVADSTGPSFKTVKKDWILFLHNEVNMSFCKQVFCLHLSQLLRLEMPFTAF
jgi:hypothetical protein